MKVETRSTKCKPWGSCSDELLFHYWDTNSPEEIEKSFKYLNKRVIRKMNLYFRIVK